MNRKWCLLLVLFAILPAILCNTIIFSFSLSTYSISRKLNKPIIRHIPVKNAYIGYDLLISCDVIYSGNFKVNLMFRKPGNWQYSIINMTHGFGNTYYAIIPSYNITSEGIEYYIYVYVNENMTATYPIENASDNPFKVSTTYYIMDLPPEIIYTGLVALLIFTVLYAVDIIDIKNPWGGKKNE